MPRVLPEVQRVPVCSLPDPVVLAVWVARVARVAQVAQVLMAVPVWAGMAQQAVPAARALRVVQ